MRQWIFLILIITLVACSKSGGSKGNGVTKGGGVGSGADSENHKITNADSTVFGMVTDSELVDSIVDFYQFTAKGTQGFLADSVRTDAQGKFSQSFNAPDGYVLIVAKKGSYTEEATGVVVDLGVPHVLKALTYFASGETVQIVVNPWSTVAVGYVECRLAEDESLETAVLEASDLISSVTGIPTQSTYPINPTSGQNNHYAVVDDGIKLGALAAGISKWTSDEAINQGSKPHGPGMTSIDFIQALYQDVRSDCRLDGFGMHADGRSTQLAFGQRLLDANVYRAEIPRKMLEFMDLTMNLTLVTGADLASYAHQQASSTAVLYASEGHRALDEHGPIVDLSIESGQYVYGQVKFKIEATDISGVKAIKVTLGDRYEMDIDVNLPEVSFASEDFDDGPIKVVVKAVDSLDKVTEYAITLNIQNAKPIMRLTSGVLVKTSRYDFEMAVDNIPQGIQSVLVNGRLFNLDGSYISGVIDLKQGENLINVELIDRMNVHHKAIKKVFLDLIKPTIDVRVPSLYPEEQFQVRYLPSGTREPVWRNLEENIGDGIFVPRNRRYCGSTLLTEAEFKALGWPYVAIKPMDAGGSPDGVLRPGNLTVTYTYQMGAEVRIKDRVASLQDAGRYYVPFCQEFLGDGWWQASDGDGEASIRFDVKDIAGHTNSKTFNFTFVESATTLKPQLGDKVFLSANSNSIAFDAVGMDGVDSVEVFIDGEHYQNLMDYTTGTVDIAAEALKDGLHEAYFVVKDEDEIILQTEPMKFRVDNSPPVVHLLSQPISGSQRYTVEFSVDDGLGSGFDLASATVRNQSLADKVFNNIVRTDAGHYEVEVDLVPGINPLLLDIKDKAGNARQEIFEPIGYDAHAPVLNWLYPDNAVNVFGYNKDDPINPIVLQPLLVSDTAYPIYLTDEMINFNPTTASELQNIQPFNDGRVGWRPLFVFSYRDIVDENEWGSVTSDHIDAYYEVYLNDRSEPIHSAKLVKDRFGLGSSIVINREDLGNNFYQIKETVDVRIKIHLEDKVGHKSVYEASFQVYFDPDA